MLLETLPVTVWLQTVAAVVAGDPGDAALPFWYVLAVVIVARLLGRALQRLGSGALLLVALPFLAVAGAVALRISPAAYGGVPGGPLDLTWLGTLGGDLVSGSFRIGHTLGLLALTSYLLWRGLRLGRVTTTLDSLRTTFTLSVAVVIAAVAVAGFVGGPGQALLAGRLAVLLPLEVFVGLVALALARTGDEAGAPGDADGWAGATSRRPWLVLALALAGVILGVTLALSLVFSYDNLIAALDRLGPVGEALSAGLQWLLYGVAYLLYLILNGLINLITAPLHQREQKIQPRPQPPPGVVHCLHGKCPQPISPIVGIVVGVFLAAVILAVLVALGYFIYRSLRLVRSRAVETDEFEERESLDGRALLGAQLRGLLAGLRRRAGPASGEEALPADSVRWLYREVLRVAAALGLGRQPVETPDEYARRLGATVASESAAGGAEAAHDLSALTAAYDRARYGETEPEGEHQREVHVRGERLVARLRGRLLLGQRSDATMRRR